MFHRQGRGRRGVNFGWNIMEGLHCYDSSLL